MGADGHVRVYDYQKVDDEHRRRHGRSILDDWTYLRATDHLPHNACVVTLDGKKSCVARGRRRLVRPDGQGSRGRRGEPVIAALFVDPRGPYFGRPDVDPWDEERDARRYAGPYPVVAHPPCERWGRYWSGGPSARVRRKKGDDGGCFRSALASVRLWGGVLEHPEASSAWAFHGIPAPPRWGGWVQTICGGWTCCVEQGHYGHRARKATWLYFFGGTPTDLTWGPSDRTARLDPGFHSAEERARVTRTGICQRMSRRQRAATPPPLRQRPARARREVSCVG